MSVNPRSTVVNARRNVDSPAAPRDAPKVANTRHRRPRPTARSRQTTAPQQRPQRSRQRTTRPTHDAGRACPADQGPAQADQATTGNEQREWTKMSSAGGFLVAIDGEPENLHRTARAPPATHRHAERHHTTPGQRPTLRPCRVPCRPTVHFQHLDAGLCLSTKCVGAAGWREVIVSATSTWSDSAKRSGAVGRSAYHRTTYNMIAGSQRTTR